VGPGGFRSNLDAWRRGIATQDEVEIALVAEVTADPRLHPVVRSLIEAYRRAGHIPVPFAERLSALEAGGTASPREEGVERPVTSGRVLANQYAVEGLVPGGDCGGSALVFKARDLIQEAALDRNPFVAVKIFNEKFTRDPESMAALHQEYKKALKLSHPNIVKLQNFNRDGADVFIVMELLEGRSLEDVVAAAKTQRPVIAQALRTIDALTQALAYAHQLGIVHSDFKPSNAFVTHDGGIKVLDFGFARAIKRTASGSRSSTGEWTHFDPQTHHVYTSCYASCEQIGGASADPRDDVYALAVVAYELLSGSHPFERKDAVTARDLGLKARHIPGLGRRQWHTIQAALSFARDQRPADAGVFGWGLKPRKWPVRLISAAAVALGVVVIAIAVLVSGWRERRDAESIAQGLDSPISAIADAAASRLAAAGEMTRETVLSKEGAKKKLLTVYERQVRAADAARAAAILARAKAVLPDYEPLSRLAESLGRDRAPDSGSTDRPAPSLRPRR
jgi:hypothetical protein